MQHGQGRAGPTHRRVATGGCLDCLTLPHDQQRRILPECLSLAQREEQYGGDSVPVISRWKLQAHSLEQGLATKTTPLSKWYRALLILTATSTTSGAEAPTTWSPYPTCLTEKGWSTLWLPDLG